MGDDLRELQVELRVATMVLVAMIRTHPNPQALLQELDGLISGLQLHTVGAGPLPDDAREALERFRSEVLRRVA